MHGTGRSLYPQSKGTKLTRRYEDRKKSSVMLEIEWAEGSATSIANEVGVLAARMKEQDISLREAHQRSQRVAGVVTGQGVLAGAIDWRAAADAFLESRSDRRGTTMADTSKRVNNAVAVLSSTPRPTDGKSLMQAYARNHFDGCAPGGSGLSLIHI